jgi:hypothetical protein
VTAAAAARIETMAVNEFMALPFVCGFAVDCRFLALRDDGATK